MKDSLLIYYGSQTLLIRNIQHDYIHRITTFLVRSKPEFIAVEDLNVNRMLKNHNLTKSIQEQTFGEFRR